MLTISAESECQIIVSLSRGQGTKNRISVIDACPEAKMFYLRPDFLRARNGTASKREISQESSLQSAQATGKEQFTCIIVDFAGSAVWQFVVSVLEFLHQICSSDRGVCLHTRGASVLKLLPSFDAQTRPKIHTFSEVQIPQCRRETPGPSKLSLYPLRQASREIKQSYYGSCPPLHNAL